MKKVLLTSTGLQYSAVAEKFLSVIPKPANELKILFFPTASRTEEEMMFVKKSQDELLDAGVSRDNILWLDVDNASENYGSADFDCIYVCGGNTFYLLKKLKESGYFTKILDWIDNGIMYVGASAGSVIAAPDINYILCMDTNDCDLNDTSGFSLISSYLIPHYAEEFTESAEIIRREYGDVLTIRDSQAYYLTDKELEMVE